MEVGLKESSFVGLLVKQFWNQENLENSKKKEIKTPEKCCFLSFKITYICYISGSLGDFNPVDKHVEAWRS